MTKVFLKIVVQKYPKKAFLVKNTQIRHFHFLQNFAIIQNRQSWFQIWQYCEIVAPKHQNNAFLIPNLGVFVFSENFAFRQTWGCWFQIWPYHFQLPVQKYPNEAFLVPNLRVLFLLQSLQQDKFEDADFKYDNNIFKFQPENPDIWHFWPQI